MTTREAMRIEQWAERMATEALLVGIDCAPRSPCTAERDGWFIHRYPEHADSLKHNHPAALQWAIAAGWLAREIFISRGGKPS